MMPDGLLAMDGKETPAAGADNATGVGAWANGAFK